MLASATLKQGLGVAAVLSLLSMGACETGKGLSLSAANLTAANTANRANKLSGGGGMSNPSTWNTTTAQPTSNEANNAASTLSTNMNSLPSSNTTINAVSRTAPTLAATLDAAVSNVGDSTGVPVGEILHLAGNAVLATGDNVSAVAAATPLDPLGAAVEGVTTPVGQTLSAMAVNDQTSGSTAMAAPATSDAPSSAAQAVAAGQPLTDAAPAAPAAIGVALLSSAPAAGIIESVGLANSGEPATVALAGTSPISTSIANAANASNSTTSVVGLTAASAAQTTGTLASVGLVSGGQLASVAVGSRPILAVPMSAPAAFATPTLPSPTVMASALPVVLAGSGSGLLGSPSAISGGSTLTLARNITFKKAF